MKAVRMHTWSGPEALVFEDAPVPELRSGDALMKVHATEMRFSKMLKIVGSIIYFRYDL